MTLGGTFPWWTPIRNYDRSSFDLSIMLRNKLYTLQHWILYQVTTELSIPSNLKESMLTSKLMALDVTRLKWKIASRTNAWSRTYTDRINESLFIYDMEFVGKTLHGGSQKLLDTKAPKMRPPSLETFNSSPLFTGWSPNALKFVATHHSMFQICLCCLFFSFSIFTPYACVPSSPLKLLPLNFWSCNIFEFKYPTLIAQPGHFLLQLKGLP